jgi:hypothetical protein
MRAFLSPEEAGQALRQLGIARNADFHELRGEVVEDLLRLADRWRYRKPSYANGARARYFHSYLQRRAKWERETSSPLLSASPLS